MEKLKTENEVLAMCYFHYLEERGFLGLNSEFLYGKLLKTASQELEEPTLIFLEMLKIFFPAGLDIPTTEKIDELLSQENAS